MTIPRDEILSQVRNHIQAAAELLRSLGGQFEQTAWMVEDSAQYVKEDLSTADTSAPESRPFEVRWQDFSYEDSGYESEAPARNGTRD